MKKLFTLLAISITAFASAQVCNPDNTTTQGIRPQSTSVPCAVQEVNFSQTYTAAIPTTFIGTYTIITVSIDSIANLPEGLTVSYDRNPPVYNAGEKACFVISGSTTAACGQYRIRVYSSIVTTQAGVMAPVEVLALENTGYNPHFIRVITQGNTCPAVNTAQDVDYVSYNTCSPLVPVVSSDAATLITNGSAQFNGTIDANTFACTAVFQWGTSTNYTDARAATPYNVSGSTPTAVSSLLYGLVDQTTYHYRLAIEYEDGIIYGEDRSFTTATPTTTGVNEINNINLKVYPNPAHNQLTVETNSNTDGTLVLSNVLGASVLNVQSNGTVTKLDVSNIPAGVYTLTFITVGKTNTTKVSIEK